MVIVAADGARIHGTSVLESVLSDLQARGYALDRPDDAGEPPALVASGDSLDAVLDADAPFAVEPVGGDPTEPVERAAHTARPDRAARRLLPRVQRRPRGRPFPGVAAMRSSGYQPVPVPLVPEHHLRWGTLAMGLAVVEGDAVRYESV